MKYKIDSETLTDIADAIRAKTGDSASMTPLEMPDEIASISGGGEPEQPITHCTTSSEMTLKTFLGTYPIPLKYRDEICWLRFYNDNPPSSGGVTGWCMFAIQNLSKDAIVSNYTNSNVSPNSVDMFSVTSTANPNYFDLTNYQITNSSSTNNTRLIPAGTVAKVLHVPIDWSTFALESTKIGGAS